MKRLSAAGRCVFGLLFDRRGGLGGGALGLGAAAVALFIAAVALGIAALALVAAAFVGALGRLAAGGFAALVVGVFRGETPGQQ